VQDRDARNTRVILVMTTGAALLEDFFAGYRSK
jgi:hypothetical protein